MLLDFLVRIEFIWYWLDGTGRWIEYGKKHSEHCAATISSSDLEAAFLADRRGVVFFSAGSQLYELNFQDMVQKNLYYQTQRKVCRWPRVVFFGGEHTRGKRCSLESSPLPFYLFPSSWDHSALPDIGYKLLVVSNSTKEYNEIKELFEKSMEGFVIRRILRNQNPSLWQVFQWQKEQMKKKNGREKVDERLLFHGTSSSHLHDICEQNFDWRICGTHGTLYGRGLQQSPLEVTLPTSNTLLQNKRPEMVGLPWDAYKAVCSKKFMALRSKDNPTINGSYFAKDASYSHRYCQPDTHLKTMFVARVLVGDYVQGNAAYLRPPTKPDRRSSFYDSCVDNLLDPSIFVIFEKHQIYPEYVIEYKRVSRCTFM